MLFANDPTWSQMVPNGPTIVPKGSQNGPTRVPKGSPEGLRIPKLTSGALGALSGIFVSGFSVLLDCFGCRFGPQWDPEGVSKSSFWGPNRHKRLQNGVLEGGREKVRKIRGNGVPKLLFYGRLEAQKWCSCVGGVSILLKLVVAEMVPKKVRNRSQNGSRNGDKMDPWGSLGESL